jgi:septum formation protein
MIDRDHPLLLGSSSPRRREILATLGLPLRVAAAEADGSGRAGEGARAYLERVTLAKLSAVRHRPEVEGAGGILVADTAVILDGAILGKPRDEADARAMIRALAGREHEVWTRFALAGPGGAAPDEAPLHAETVATQVRFRALDDDEIAGYAATGEGLDKAGAYAVQGIGAFAVARVEGSYSNVVGLPACEVVAALRRTGLLARFPAAP